MTKLIQTTTTVAQLPAALLPLVREVWKGTKTQGIKKSVELSHVVDGERHVGRANLLNGPLPDHRSAAMAFSQTFADMGRSLIWSLGELRRWFQPVVDASPEIEEPRSQYDMDARRVKRSQGTAAYRVDTQHWMGSDGESNTDTLHVCPFVEATASADSYNSKKIYVTVYHQRPLTLAEAILFREVGFSDADQVMFDAAMGNGSLTEEQFQTHLNEMLVRSYAYDCDIGPFADAYWRELGKARFPILSERAAFIASGRATDADAHPEALGLGLGELPDGQEATIANYEAKHARAEHRRSIDVEPVSAQEAWLASMGVL